jgi:hypothetical protein
LLKVTSDSIRPKSGWFSRLTLGESIVLPLLELGAKATSGTSSDTPEEDREAIELVRDLSSDIN